MLENTIENKNKFTMQYYGQPVYWCGRSEQKEPYILGIYPDVINKYQDTSYLKLTELFNITDEHSTAVAKILGLFEVTEIIRYSDYILLKQDSQHSVEIWFNGELETTVNGMGNYATAVDYIRSLGYEYPYMDVTVDEQRNRGWIK